ncbi:MAG: C39 family peptidase, partial [Akkermansiaceae bacterium]|nr:C39 family peptidase [Verrucomicrobiales bacterium]
MKRSHLQLLTDFSGFQRQVTQVPNEVILTSPEISPPNDWRNLVASWNVELPSDASLKIEARGIYPDHVTKFYALGLWSADPTRHPRESVVKQKDADGDVHTDTLVLNRPGPKLQLRITLVGTSPKLKLIALSFLDPKAAPLPLEPNKAAWGKSVSVPERSQVTYEAEGGKGWCSPTSLSMVLASWADRLKRPELDIAVPVVARSVFDRNWPGTGNWPFNTAFAGAFPGMRAYVSRFDSITELEDWIVAGIPVILSAPYQLLGDQESGSGNGHVVVCTGFTETGDVIVHDPWA